MIIQHRAWMFFFSFILCTSVLGGCYFGPRPDIERPGNEDFSFVAIGDVRGGHVVFSLLGEWTLRIRPRPFFCAILGDLINEPGNEVELRSYGNIAGRIEEGMPVYAVPGNHDVDDAASEGLFKRNVRNSGKGLYFSLSRGLCHFIFLDTEIPEEINSIAGDQLTWLTSELDACAPSFNIFVFMHRPLYPQGSHRGENLNNADALHSLFSEHGVRAVFAGHDHEFYRYVRDGIPYIATGGGGSPPTPGEGGYHHLLKVSLYGNLVRIQTYDLYGENVHTIDI